MLKKQGKKWVCGNLGGLVWRKGLVANWREEHFLTTTLFLDGKGRSEDPSFACAYDYGGNTGQNDFSLHAFAPLIS